MTVFTEEKVFALYKGDKFLACGTISEIADSMSLKESTVKYYARPSYIKRRKENGYSNFRELIELEG
jgi:hypothetical protein